jgi:prevent-host-death family protein
MMGGRIIGVKEACRKLPRLLREVETGRQIVLGRRGKPVVMIAVREYNSIMATLEEMAGPHALLSS